MPDLSFSSGDELTLPGLPNQSVAAAEDSRPVVVLLVGNSQLQAVDSLLAVGIHNFEEELHRDNHGCLPAGHRCERVLVSFQRG